VVRHHIPTRGHDDFASAISFTDLFVALLCGEFGSKVSLVVDKAAARWQNFKTVLLKAQIASENSGNDPADHFIGASKMVAIGSDAKREVEDMHLSRCDCYLVLQNADPTKEVVALGQTYFVVQTRR